MTHREDPGGLGELCLRVASCDPSQVALSSSDFCLLHSSLVFLLTKGRQKLALGCAVGERHRAESLLPPGEIF